MNIVTVPHLFRIKTKASKIYGFSLFDLKELQNVGGFKVKNNHSQSVKTYLYQISKKIRIPEKFEAMYRWYLLANQKIYYQRPVTRNFSFKLMYDLRLNKLIVSPGYHHLVRFELGNIWPPGKILANFIAYDLQKLGFGVFHGMSLRYKGKVACVFAPGGNFKTPLLKVLLSQGAEYIAGDTIVIKDGEVYFMPPCKGDKISIDCQRITTYKHKITHVFFVFRSENTACHNLKNIEAINSYLTAFSLFNVLGTGWALNFRRIIDMDTPINSWYDFLDFREIHNFKLIKEENFTDLVPLFLKELV